ncbi:MAG TPA: polysaccharide deacetylase family protein [Segetibacter sp.]|jgi:hypothetical protein
MNEKKVLLSFDVEEFDMPLEYGQHISMEQQLQTGFDGFTTVMKIIDDAGIPVTLFTTANFALNYSSYMQMLLAHHEIASHTFYHSTFKTEDLLASRITLEKICNRKVKGLRMPRMRKVHMHAVKAAGYYYDSSINPTWIPGRYNNFHLPRTIYSEDEILVVPASVSPAIRIPLFWLSFKNLPYKLFLNLVRQTLHKDGYVCLYFHPWEFVNLEQFSIPRYSKRIMGEKLQYRLMRLINDLKKEASFSTIENYLQAGYLKDEK